MKENIKLALLGLIVLGLGINAYLLYDNDNSGVKNESKLIGAKSSHDRDHDHSANTNPEVKEPEKSKHPVTSIAFNEIDHDFGTINQNTTNLHVFEFTNTGSNPLIIESAKGSCGCTVPEYPKKPIMPGESEEIKVEYKPAKQEGPQSKTITIIANTGNPTTKLQIRANVIKRKTPYE